MKESCKNIEKEREKYSVHMKRTKEDFYRDFYFVLFRERRKYYVERYSQMERLYYYFYKISDVSFSRKPLSILYYHTMIIKEIGYDETY